MAGRPMVGHAGPGRPLMGGHVKTGKPHWVIMIVLAGSMFVVVPGLEGLMGRLCCVWQETGWKWCWAWQAPGER